MSEQQPTGAGTGKRPVNADEATAGDTSTAASQDPVTPTSEAPEKDSAEAASTQTTNAELRDELDSIRAIGER